MPTSGIFVYSILNDEKAGIGTGNISVDGNGFVETTRVSGVVSIPSFIGTYRVVSILSYATRKCNLITKIILPNTLTTLNSASLTELSGIEEVKIPASITKIYDYNDCFRNAKRIIFEKGSRLEYIGKYFMRYSPYIEDVVFPSHVKELGSYFAQGCTGLKRVFCCGNNIDFSAVTYIFDGVANKNNIQIIVSYEYAGQSFGGFSVLVKTFEQCIAKQKIPICSASKCSNIKAFIHFMSFVLCC